MMVYTMQNIGPVVEDIRQQGHAIVLATGFFDLLHAEHINFLAKARAAGDVLIVAVESDARARALKGDGRPVQPQAERCHQVAGYADYVIALDDDFDSQEAYERFMEMLKPDVYAVSSHTSHLENKRILTEKYGGRLVIVHEFNPEVSTSKILASRRKQL